MIRAAALLACAAAALGGAGCDDDPGVGGPRARIEHFTGCVVPSGAVRVHDEVGGTADQFVVHAKVVFPKAAFPAFLASCGTSEAELQPGYDTHPMLPASPIRFWNPPDRQLNRGVALTRDGRTVEIVTVERDTDFAVYLRSVGRSDG